MMRCACCCLSADVPIQLGLHKVSGSHLVASSSFNIPVVAFFVPQFTAGGIAAIAGKGEIQCGRYPTKMKPSSMGGFKALRAVNFYSDCEWKYT